MQINKLRSAIRITILSILLIGLISSNPAVAATHIWTDTTQGEFDAGTKTDVNTTLIPNSVILDSSATETIPEGVAASSAWSSGPITNAINDITGDYWRSNNYGSIDEWIRFTLKNDTYITPTIDPAASSAWSSGLETNAINGNTADYWRAVNYGSVGEWIRFPIIEEGDWTTSGITSTTKSSAWSSGPESNATNDNITDYWRSDAYGSTTEWIQFNFAGPTAVSGVRLYTRVPQMVSISTDDGIVKPNVFLGAGWNYFSWTPADTVYIKVAVTGLGAENHAYLYEFDYRSAAPSATVKTNGVRLYTEVPQVADISISNTDDTSYTLIKRGVLLAKGWSHFSWDQTDTRYIKVTFPGLGAETYAHLYDFGYRTETPAVGQTSGIKVWSPSGVNQTVAFTISDTDDTVGGYSDYYEGASEASASSAWSSGPITQAIDTLPTLYWRANNYGSTTDWIRFVVSGEADYTTAGITSVTRSSAWSSAPEIQAIDTLPTLYWRSDAYGSTTEWIQFNFAGPTSVSGVRLYTAIPQRANIITDDGTVKSNVFLAKGWNYFSWSPADTAYIRVTVTDLGYENYAFLGEFGYRSGATPGGVSTKGIRIYAPYAQTVDIAISNTDDEESAYTNIKSSHSLSAGWNYPDWTGSPTDAKYIKVTHTNLGSQTYAFLGEFGYRSGAHTLPQSATLTGNTWNTINWTGGSRPTKYVKATITDLAGQNYAFVSDLKFVAGGYDASGNLVSSSKFTNGIPAYGTISWDPPTQPPTCGADSLKFQIATENNSNPTTFKGPDGTAGTYYTNPAGEAIHSSHDGAGNQYLKYKAYLSTTKTLVSPRMDNVSITWNAAPATPTNSAPTGTIAELNPTFSWSAYSDSNGDLQEARQVRLRTSAGAYGDGSSKDSGEVAGTADNWTPTTWNLGNGTYYFQVRVKDDSGWANNWSYWSTETSFVVNLIPPDAPTSVTASPVSWTTTDNFDFTWVAPTVTFPQSPIAGYYYKTGAAPTSNTDGTWTTNTYINDLTAVSEGTNDFYVFAEDDTGMADYNNYGTTNYYLDTTEPGNPTSTLGWGEAAQTNPITSGSPYSYTNPRFIWSGADDGDGSGIKGYHVYFGTNSGADPETSGTYQTSTTYDAAGMTFGNTYYLLIKSVDNLDQVSSAKYTAFQYVYAASDTTPPSVINIYSNNAAGSYKEGQTIAVRVAFDEPVTVNTSGGTPTLDLNSGGSAVATYNSGSGTDTLIFNYTVGAGDTSSDLGYDATNSLKLNGGTIKDAATNDADLTLFNPGNPGSLRWNESLIIDTTAPPVTNVTSAKTNGTYTVGELIPITVTFNEAVNVNTGGGTPTLALDSGGTATYASGTGTNDLIFNYTVGASQNSSDLDYVATGSLVLNGGTIQDAATNNAVLTLPAPGGAGSLAGNKSIVIDTTGPAVSNVTSTKTNDTYTVGANMLISVTFDKIVTVVGGPPSLTLDSGGTATYNSGSGTSTIFFDYTVGAGQDSADLDATTLNLNGATIQDGIGNDAVLSLPAPGAAGSLSLNKDIAIDTTGPIVSNITSTAINQTYGVAAVIPITVTFDTPAVVNTSGGTPILGLNSGGGAVAFYNSGSGSTDLIFNYTVGVGQSTSDLDYSSANALVLGGGTIKDAVGNDANPMLPNPGASGSLGLNKDIAIDSDAPTIESVTINGRRFLAGDVLPKGKTDNTVSIKAIDVTGTPTITMLVDSTPVSLTGPAGGPPEWISTGTFASPPSPPEVHDITLSVADDALNTTLTTLEVIVGAGGVQVIGTPLNYPNPFRPLSGGPDAVTKIQYKLSDDAPIEIIILNIAGEEVRRGKYSPGASGGQAGINTIEWDGKSMGGQVVGNGMYIYIITSGGRKISTGRLVVRDE
ncbi:hypothetical protein ACFLZ2_05010 [Candidatus Margulisiibacteriota bacterium]